MKNSNRGFTLIELLVVIAIIGILSSVVLASLTTARSKGADASIQAQLSNMRAQAELFYSTTGGTSYGTSSASSCAGGSLYATGTTNSLAGLLGGQVSTASPDCGVSAVSSTVGATTWSVAAKTSTGAFCVDNTGTARSKMADGVTAYTAVIGATTGAHNAAGSAACQ